MSSSSSSPSSSSSSSSPSDQIFTSFFSKVEELITDHTNNFNKSIRDLKLNLKSLQKSLLLLNAKTSDVNEQIKFLEGLGQKKRKRDIEEWLVQVKSIENEVIELQSQAESHGFIRNLMDGGKVAQLNEKIVMLIEQSQHLDGCGTMGGRLLTTRMVGKTFEANCNKILSLLETRKVSSIGIHGMGGVGKTALAKCINNRLVKQSKVRVFWIRVSQEFTIQHLQDKIAYFLGINFSGENDEDIRAVRLHEALSRMKNSILILDDVWKNIDMLKVGCPVSKECCRLIMTTRSLEVCRQIRCQEVIGVRTLSKDEAWKLFNDTLNLGEEIELSPHVKRIVESVLRSCDGLPLGIITVAENMRGKTSIHAWTAALAELEEPVTKQGGITDDEIFRVLKYSFDRLNDRSKEFNLLQLCFLYCSLFPQDSLPGKDKMVERFISEGLMDGRKSRRAQVLQGYNILDKLVNLSLLDTYNGHPECLMMHNLVRGMALKINEGKYMARGGRFCSREIPGEEEWTKDLEKVALMLTGTGIIPEGMSPNCPNLSTLLLYENPLEVIPDSFFCKMQGLCTLDLCCTDITMLPDSLSEMRSLKALLLELCRNLYKVPYLGKLKALRELNLSFTGIEEVPQGVEELCNLRFLSMAGTDLEMLPSGLLRKLGHLEYLRLPVKVQAPAEEIANVDQFWGRFNDVRAFNFFIQSRPHDAFYLVQVGQYYSDEDDEDDAFYHVHDREVHLSKCNLEGERVLGTGIESLTIRKCEGLSKCLLDDFSPTCYPKSLKKLTIERCGGVECALMGARESLSPFSTLETIHLEGLQDFMLIQKTETGAAPAPAPAPARAVFPHLQMLTIANCNKMTTLGLPIWGVPSLKHLKISNCGAIEEIFEDEGRGFATLPKLQRLSLFGLPRLKIVCEATMICNSIKSIRIVRCQKLLNKLPLQLKLDILPPPPSYIEIRVEREWWESLEWDDSSLPRLLQPFVIFEQWEDSSLPRLFQRFVKFQQ